MVLLMHFPNLKLAYIHPFAFSSSVTCNVLPQTLYFCQSGLLDHPSKHPNSLQRTVLPGPGNTIGRDPRVTHANTVTTVQGLFSDSTGIIQQRTVTLYTIACIYTQLESQTVLELPITYMQQHKHLGVTHTATILVLVLRSQQCQCCLMLMHTETHGRSDSLQQLFGNTFFSNMVHFH